MSALKMRQKAVPLAKVKKKNKKGNQQDFCDFLITCAFVILSQILHSFLGEISNRFYSGKSKKRNI